MVERVPDWRALIDAFIVVFRGGGGKKAIGKARQIIQFSCTVDQRMARQDLFYKRGPGPRHADDEDWSRCITTLGL